MEDAALLKELTISAKYDPGSVDVVATDQDTLIVRSGGTTLATYPVDDAQKFSEWSQAFGGSGTAVAGGSPTILTVHRIAVGWRRGKMWKWRVSFAFGGNVDVWATKTMEDQRRFQWKRSENVMLWMWINIPSSLTSTAEGICANHCNSNVRLPYTWCQGNPQCLPKMVQDTGVWSTSEITALENACGLSVGSSQRPDVCTTRPTSDVDCGQTQAASGGFYNRQIPYKWPKNLNIDNDRNSGSTGCGDCDSSTWPFSEAAYDGILGFNDMAEQRGYYASHTDGVCDAGAKCATNPTCKPPSGSNCCKVT